MNNKYYPEIKPGKKIIKKIYLGIFLWIFGRGMQATCRVDKMAKKEFDTLKDDFLMAVAVMPNGPYLILGKDKKGKAKYMGWKHQGKTFDVFMKIKNIETAIQAFTFQQSLPTAYAHDGFIIDGNLMDVMTILRIIDIVEVLLLPKIVTKMGIKRYPNWSEVSPFRKWINRMIVYVRVFSF